MNFNLKKALLKNMLICEYEHVLCEHLEELRSTFICVACVKTYPKIYGTEFKSY